jgi:hypothetical protein
MAECDGYKAGIVAVFRKYEGERTDEVDASNRVVKVNAKNFADHSGIPYSTFRSWLGRLSRTSSQPRTGTARSGQMGRQIAKNPTVPVEDKVGMLKDLMSDRKVMKAWQDARTPVVSEHDAKAAQAVASAMTQPILDAATPLQVPMMLDRVKSVAAFIAENDLDEEAVRKFRRAATKLTNEIEVQEFRLGLMEVS